jgi:DNA-binding MarR family transcriptional regulator
MSMRLSDVRALAESIDQLAVWLRRSVPPEISSSAVSALHRLSTEGPLRVSDLAVREAMTQPGVTMLVNRLSDAGYTERVPDPTDRRAALVRITPAGTALLDARHSARADLLRARIAELDVADRDLLVAALPAIERLVPSRPDIPGK